MNQQRKNDILASAKTNRVEKIPIVESPYEPEDINSIWLKDGVMRAFDVGHWEPLYGEGGEADWNASEGEPGYVKNRPMYKTVTTEHVVIGKPSDLIGENITPGSSLIMYTVFNSRPDERYGIENYHPRNLAVIEGTFSENIGDDPTFNAADTGYFICNIYSWEPVGAALTTQIPSDDTDNLTRLYNSKCFIKSTEDFSQPSEINSYLCVAVGLDPDTVTEQQLSEHAEEMYNILKDYLYTIDIGTVLLDTYYYDEVQQETTGAAYLLNPSSSYLSYWEITGSPKLVRIGVYSNPDSYTIELAPTMDQIYNDPTYEEEDAYYDKVKSTTLGDLGLDSLYEADVENVTYTQLDEEYLPDSMKPGMITEPKIIGYYDGGDGKMPVIECTIIEAITIDGTQTSWTVNISAPTEVVDMMFEAVKKIHPDAVAAYFIGQPTGIMSLGDNRDATGSFSKIYSLTTPDVYFIHNYQVVGISSEGRGKVTLALEKTSPGTYSGNTTFTVLMTVRYYACGNYDNGTH